MSSSFDRRGGWAVIVLAGFACCGLACGGGAAQPDASGTAGISGGGASGSAGSTGAAGAPASGAGGEAGAAAGTTGGVTSDAGTDATGRSGAGGAGGSTAGTGGTTGANAGSGGRGTGGGAGAMGRGGAAGTAAAGSTGAGGGRGGTGGSGGRAGASGGTGAAGTTGGAGTGGNVGPTPDTTTRMKCTGTDPIACHFGGQPGNYDVTVILGGAAAANTVTSAETNRAMLAAVATTAGETRRFTFTVNVRQPEGQPIENVPAGTPGLDVYFAGNAGSPPALQAIGYAAATSPFMIYLAGDSTVCDQSDTNYAGWGQWLPPYFDFPVSIANYADSGESSGSFLNSSSLFGAITSRLKAGDWVFIQFGHNDKDTTATAFHDNMTKLVTGVKAKGGNAVLVTPPARATFSGSTLTAQHINSTGANLPQIIEQVGTEQNVPVLDLTTRTTTWLNQLGPNGWQPYHALGTDATHTNPAGAAVIAGFVHDLIAQANLGALTAHFR